MHLMTSISKVTCDINKMKWRLIVPNLIKIHSSYEHVAAKKRLFMVPTMEYLWISPKLLPY